MKLFIQILFASLFITEIMGCSSTPRMTKWSTPTFRIMVNPDGIDSDSYVRIQNSLVNSHKYFVVDRGQAFQGIVGEQNLTRVASSESRFDDKEKFARLRRLYGVGGLVQAHLQCAPKTNIWGRSHIDCVQFLALYSTNTGQILASAENEVQTGEPALWISSFVSPAWDDIVGKLNANVPEHFEKEEWTEDMQHYKEVNREEALREEGK